MFHPYRKKGFVSFSGLIIDHYSQKCWVTNFPTLTPPWNRGEKVKEFKIFNLVWNGHVSIISNESFERKYYVSGFIFFHQQYAYLFVLSYRTWEIPKKYHSIQNHNSTKHNRQTARNLVDHKLATEFEKKNLLPPTLDSYPRVKDTSINSADLASDIYDGFERK